MNKRELLKSAASATALALMAGRPALAKTRKSKTIVLVHGAFCGGFVWDGVAELLRNKGHVVYAPSLTGLGDRSHLANPDINLTTHINDVRNLLRYRDMQDICLVGHSYAGMVITGVAKFEAERIASLVYLDALLPGLFSPTSRPRTADNPANTMALTDAMAESFHIKPQDRWKYSPHPLGTLQESFDFQEAYKKIRNRTYVRAGASPSFADLFKRLEADRDWKTIQVADSGHMLMFDATKKTAEIIAGAAA